MPSLKDPVPRQCARDGCETVFLPKHGRAKYCSKQCLWKVKNDASAAKPDYNQKARAYRARDPEKWKARSKKDYWDNRDARREDGKKRYQVTRQISPWSTLIDSAKARAKKKSLPFNLTKEWAKERWTGFCEVSKLPFLVGALGGGPKPMAATIDRIDPKLGYAQSNCRIVIQAVNAMKGIMTDEEMIMVAKAIIANSSPS